MDKINLKEILNRVYDKEYRSNYKTEYSEQCILKAMKEACNQVLKLAAENAEIDVVDHEEWDRNKLPGTKDFAILPIYGVDEDSILKTINQIE